jgi:Phospholipase_D-nuclease N-terminal
MRPGLILVVLPVVILVVAWEVFCLHDLARADRVRYLPKWGWALVCLVSIPWGGIIYLIVGRTGD